MGRARYWKSQDRAGRWPELAIRWSFRFRKDANMRSESTWGMCLWEGIFIHLSGVKWVLSAQSLSLKHRFLPKLGELMKVPVLWSPTSLYKPLQSNLKSPLKIEALQRLFYHDSNEAPLMSNAIVAHRSHGPEKCCVPVVNATVLVLVSFLLATNRTWLILSAS